MITTYSVTADGLRGYPGFITGEHLEQACWIDLHAPTDEEEEHVERVLGVGLPTREEMKALEESHRLFEEAGAVYLTARIIVNSESEYPRSDDISFVLTPACLVTVRYAEPRALRLFLERCERHAPADGSPEGMLLGLLETLLERVADSIERVGGELDALVHDVLAPTPQTPGHRPDYALMLRRLERNQVLITRARASLTSLHRMLAFLNRPGLAFTLSPGALTRAATLLHDVQALTDHTTFLAGNLAFELDAILGMITIEQNGIIKIFSVAAVVFLPPTLVASIYGMNFEIMPELAWAHGYAWALCLMVASAVVTYQFFKRRGWL